MRKKSNQFVLFCRYISKDDPWGLTFICLVGCIGYDQAQHGVTVHALNTQCHTVSMFRFKGQGTLGVKHAPVFKPQILKMATGTSTSYDSLPERNSGFQDDIHSKNDSSNRLLHFHHSGRNPSARSGSSPEQQVDNRLEEAASRSTQERTTNCVITASVCAYKGGLCDGGGPSCDGLVTNINLPR